MNMIMMESKPSWAARIKRHGSKVLTVGNVRDTELVHHTYATSGDVNELEKLVSNYLEDCGCDYDWRDIETAVDTLCDDGAARIGNHFFNLTELENA